MPDDLRRRGKDQPTAVVSSAAILSERKLPIPKPEAWQEEAWNFYDTTPEVRFAVSWLSNALSRCHIGAAHGGSSGDEPSLIVDDQGSDEPLPEAHAAARDLMENFAGGPTTQSQILGACAVHLTVPGDGYLVGTPAEDGLPEGDDTGPDDWGVYSADELSTTASGEYVLSTGENTRDKEVLPESALILRLWRRHPRKHWRSDSPLRATLGVLRELQLLTQQIEAAAVSRLAGAGILVLPEEMTFAVSEANKEKDDPFIHELMDTMVTPIQDRSAASAVVPLVVRVKGEFISQIEHLTFGTPLDDKAMALREEAIKRFAAGMDLPAEVVLGLADSNHWTAWQIEESAVKLHVEPMMEAICEAITIGYLHPAMESLGLDTTGVFVWYDASPLTVQPDRSGDAREAYRDGVIGSAAYLRAIGMSTDDAPTEEELRTKIILDVIRSLPSSAPALLPALGIDVDIDTSAPQLEAPEETIVEEPADGSEEDSGGTGTPDRPGGPPTPGEAALVAASDMLVCRALERAGARLSNRARAAGLTNHGCPTDVLHTCLPEECRTEDVDYLLEGAWDRVPVVAARYDMDPHALTATLDRYTRALIAGGWPHESDDLEAVLLGT